MITLVKKAKTNILKYLNHDLCIYRIRYTINLYKSNKFVEPFPDKLFLVIPKVLDYGTKIGLKLISHFEICQNRQNCYSTRKILLKHIILLINK